MQEGFKVLDSKAGLWACLKDPNFVPTISTNHSMDCFEFSNMSQCMRFPTMWHFDMCRLGKASTASF